MRTIALVNDRHCLATPVDQHGLDIAQEDQHLLDAFAQHGARAVRVDWAAAIDWSAFDAALIRQTWDYFDRLQDYARWVQQAATATKLINPDTVVRWNWDKRYLLELAQSGLPVVPTVLVTKGDTDASLKQRMAENGWSECVIKPAVSASGYETHRIDIRQAEQRQSRWQRLLGKHDMLIQPFQPSIVEHGEVSLIVIDQQVTHAVRKVARPGEFRVQSDHGGRIEAYQPSETELALAQRAMAGTPAACLYGRVDLVDSDQGPVVMELELIEPELFFRLHGAAADRLAKAVLASF